MSNRKLILHSNAPWTSTGYGQQTALLAPRLAEKYDLAISSFFGLEGSPITWEGIPVFPGIQGEYGDGVLVQHAREFFGNPRDGLVITLMDVWVLDAAPMSQMNVACWTPVDHQPAPDGVLNFLVDANAIPIAMSRFGERELGRLDPLYVPHGVDTSVYRPHDKHQVRKQFGFPDDAFLVGMVAANKGWPSRKGFSQAFQAFAKLLERHDNAYLYLHTMMNPGPGRGEDLPRLLNALGVPEDRVRISSQYRMLFQPFSPANMALVYSALDVLLNPALGEGFGIPIIEAQACGTPVIVTDFTAMSELCGAGWKVKSSPFWTGMNAWQAFPDVDDITEALIACRNLSPEQRASLSRMARDHAVKYDVNAVFDKYWLPALRTVEQRFDNQEPVTIAPRQLKVAA
jgi:glycosyltransferase involved in cell wall biosynthesis